MNSAAVGRDVREVVEGRTCVKIHSLPVTGVGLCAIDPSYASDFDECDNLGTKTSTLQTGRRTTRVEPPRVDIARRGAGFTNALATVNRPARTTRIAVCE